MIILLDVPKKGCSPREDAHSLGRARGLAYCQAQSRLGLASATPNVLGAWQHVRQANIRSNTLSQGRACLSKNLYF